MTKKELQSRIYNSVKDAPIIGEQESADKHCVKYTTLMRILYGNEAKVVQIGEKIRNIDLAAMLGISRQLLNHRVKKYNIPYYNIRGVRCFDKDINISQYIN